MNKLQIKQTVESFDKKLKSSLSPSTYQDYKYGRYDLPSRKFKIDSHTIAVIAWDNSSDWNYYAKSYNFPKNTYSNRRVYFETINRRTGVVSTKAFPLESFAASFLEAAIDWFFGGINAVSVEKSLKPVQLSSKFSIKKIKTVSGIEIYSRSIGKVWWDFVAVKNGLTFHSYSLEKALQGLHEKIEKSKKAEILRLEKDNTILSAEKVRQLYGFCMQGIRSFCELNKLDVNASYTIREIRNAVIKKRSENCSRFKNELKLMGVALNC